MEKPLKIPESKHTKKDFELPGKQKMEWESDPRTGEILSLTKKDAKGHVLEFYDLRREELAQIYETHEKAASQPEKLKCKTPTEQSPEQKAAEDKTSYHWQRYGERWDPKTHTTAVFFHNAVKNHFLEITQDNDSGKVSKYVERDAAGDIVNFENFDATARNPSDLQSQLDQAKNDHTYFKELENSGWKPTQQ
ncbi:MAG: hypothetical protein HZC14_00425 [Candidatus Niyogibacteria bacterium]|nr:hypothetical protein [Candidatus Niyogibacteria bacterium]